MANAHRGEASFRIGGTTYTFAYDVDALCQIEEASDKAIATLLDELGRPGATKVSTARYLVWGGLREHHPQVDLKAAGNLVLEGKEIVLEAMKKALTAAFPAEAEDRADAPGKSKRTPAGTG